MRTLPIGLSQKLADGVTTLAQAWRLTRGDGVIVALTQHDRDLSFDGTLFSASQGLFGGAHEGDLDLAPDRSALSGALSVDAITEADLKLGRWSGAKVEAFWVDWTNPIEFIAMWRGQVDGATWRGGGFELDIVGQEASLSGEIGRVYARTCDATLGDGRCKVDLAQSGRTFSATIIAIASDRSVTIALPAGKTASHFVDGRIAISSGVATGWRAGTANVVANGATWLLSLNQPFPVMPAASDAITVSMGCDKGFGTCKDRFNNSLNFRGQPTMPGDDVAFGGPATAGNDGGKR